MTRSPDPEAARREWNILARYLLGRKSAGEAPPLYVAARERLFTGNESGASSSAPLANDGLLEFALRHPWSLGPLDAASALLRPQSSLRRRLLAVSAILEAASANAHRFLPRSRSPFDLCILLAWNGARWMAKLVAGLALWPLASGGRA